MWLNIENVTNASGGGEGRQEKHVCEDDWLQLLLEKPQELSPIPTEGLGARYQDDQTHKRTFTLLMRSLVAHNS